MESESMTVNTMTSSHTNVTETNQRPAFCGVCVREEFLLKTDSDNPKDTGSTLFTLATPGRESPSHFS